MVYDEGHFVSFQHSRNTYYDRVSSLLLSGTSMDLASFTTMIRAHSVAEVREDMGKLVKFVYV